MSMRKGSDNKKTRKGNLLINTGLVTMGAGVASLMYGAAPQGSEIAARVELRRTKAVQDVAIDEKATKTAAALEEEKIRETSEIIKAQTKEMWGLGGAVAGEAVGLGLFVQGARRRRKAETSDSNEKPTEKPDAEKELMNAKREGMMMALGASLLMGTEAKHANLMKQESTTHRDRIAAVQKIAEEENAPETAEAVQQEQNIATSEIIDVAEAGGYMGGVALATGVTSAGLAGSMLKRKLKSRLQAEIDKLQGKGRA